MIPRVHVGLLLLLFVGRTDAGTLGQPGATVSSLLGGGSSSPFPQPTGKSPVAAKVQSVRHAAMQSQQQIHPAVVRVVAPGRGSISYGSGTLVDVEGEYGLVVTNYHVINEATGNISVVFPDGFYSLATVRKVDRDWDLAALVIKRPNVPPVPISLAAPRPGEPLTIAGYGSGNYRAVAGRCTQYVAPGTRMPFEMVELAASARQGDSGGPILNQRGELAGVLFGEGGGRTAGSYCGRVKWFLASLVDRPMAPKDLVPTMPPVEQPVMVAQMSSLPPPRVRLPRQIEEDRHETMEEAPAITSIPLRAPTHEFAAASPQNNSFEVSTRPSLSPTSDQVGWSEIAGDTLVEQLKTFLAIFGGCAALMLLMRVAVGSPSK